jgi:hypothetical protein
MEPERFARPVDGRDRAGQRVADPGHPAAAWWEPPSASSPAVCSACT